MLNIRSKTMLSGSHSWAITMKNLLSCWDQQGHKLYLNSINGEDLISPRLKSRLGRELKIPDLDICYTMPRNFKDRFQEKSKLKLAIYNYETSIMPKVWVNEIKYLDYVLPSSQFSKEVFVNSGWPEQKCLVIPHGIDLQDFQDQTMYSLQTKKSFKFLNVSIPHYRKNIDLLLDAYFSLFSDQDDVCLVLKTDLNPPPRALYDFEVNVKKVIMDAQQKHRGRSGGLPQLEIVNDRLENMVHLYNACQVLISASSSEGFGLPLLEGIAAEKLVVAPRCTGQLDFLNDQNSLLVDVKTIDAGKKYQYWKATPGAQTYLPEIDDLKRAMLEAYQNYQVLQDKFKEERAKTVQQFTWEKAAQKILEIR